MPPSVRDLVHRRLTHIRAGMTQTECGVQESEPSFYTVDLEDHAVAAIWRRQIDLQPVRELGAARSLSLAGLQLIDRDSAALELGTRVLSDTTGGR
jgi:hypothetical protein